MDCTRARELTNLHPTDRTAEEQAELDTHLNACEECRDEAALMGSLDDLMGNVLAATAGSAGTIAMPPPSSFASRRRIPWAAAAAVLLSEGEIERAIEIYALACTLPAIANSQWFEDVVVIEA